MTKRILSRSSSWRSHLPAARAASSPLRGVVVGTGNGVVFAAAPGGKVTMLAGHAKLGTRVVFLHGRLVAVVRRQAAKAAHVQLVNTVRRNDDDRVNGESQIELDGVVAAVGVGTVTLNVGRSDAHGAAADRRSPMPASFVGRDGRSSSSSSRRAGRACPATTTSDDHGGVVTTIPPGHDVRRRPRRPRRRRRPRWSRRKRPSLARSPSTARTAAHPRPSAPTRQRSSAATDAVVEGVCRRMLRERRRGAGRRPAGVPRRVPCAARGHAARATARPGWPRSRATSACGASAPACASRSRLTARACATASPTSTSWP